MHTSELLLVVEKLEELMLKTWSYFIDRTRLVAFTLENIRDHAEFVEAEESPPCEDMRFSLSRLDLTSRHACEVWVEFVVPTPDGVAVGTSEILLGFDGGAVHVKTVGTIHKVR